MSDPADLARIEPEWWELWRRCPAATPFGSPAWCLPWWEVFAPGRLAAITARADGRLVGLAPTYIEDGAYGRRLLPIGIGISDYLDVLIDPDGPKEVHRALVDAAEGMPGWDSWRAEELMPDAGALGLPCPTGCEDELAEQGACPVLDLTAEGEPVPSGKRRKLRMAEHRLARRGGIVRSVASGAVPRFFNDLTRLHGARWSERGEGGVLAQDAVIRFHRAALPRLAGAGLARLYEAAVDDRVIGCFYGFADATRTHAYIGGFDPEFAFESPGTVLVGHAIAEARRAGLREFHFLRGQEPYKYEWGATDRMNRRRSFRRVQA